MARLHEVVQPTDWPRPSGYSNAIIAQGRTLFIAGQIGWNPVTRVVASDDFAAQARQALENIIAVLRAAQAGPEHVVRMTWYITDRATYTATRSELGRAWRELFGAHYPAMSVVVVAGLLEEHAKVEIEATAVLPMS